MLFGDPLGDQVRRALVLVVAVCAGVGAWNPGYAQEALRPSGQPAASAVPSSTRRPPPDPVMTPERERQLREYWRTSAEARKKARAAYDSDDDYIGLGYNSKGEGDAYDGNDPFTRRLIDKAVDEAQVLCRNISGQRVCRPGSKRACLQGVRMAVQKALCLPDVPWTANAKDAGPHLEKNGFKKMEGWDRFRKESKEIPVGAIIVYDVEGNPGAAGHIEIRGKNGYYSDYRSDNWIRTSIPTRRVIGIYIPDPQKIKQVSKCSGSEK